ADQHLIEQQGFAVTVVSGPYRHLTRTEFEPVSISTAEMQHRVDGLLILSRPKRSFDLIPEVGQLAQLFRIKVPSTRERMAEILYIETTDKRIIRVFELAKVDDLASVSA